jgi:hypothetical protein
MGLMTENVQGSMFDNFKVDHEDCFVDPFDSDKAKKYKVKTQSKNKSQAKKYQLFNTILLVKISK